MTQNTSNISLSFVADSNKCFSLWLNSARKEVFDKVIIHVKNHKAFNQNGRPSEDFFSINDITKKITDNITQKIIDKFVQKYEDRPTKDESDPDFKKEISKKLEQACQRTFVSATFIDDKHTNDFNETIGILFNINYRNKDIKISAANNTDAMTSNIDHLITRDIIMTSDDAFDKLCDWDEHIRQKICGKIQRNDQLNDATKSNEKKYVNELIESLKTNRTEIKEMCDNLYTKATSTQAKTELDKCMKPGTRELMEGASEVARLKYDILAKSEVIIKAEKELEKIIKEHKMNLDIIRDAFNKNLALNDLAKANSTKYQNGEKPEQQIYFRENEASIAEAKNWDQYYSDFLKSAFFGSNKPNEANKRSEYAGYMNIGLRYFFANDIKGREMEKNRFYVFSKNMPQLKNENYDTYYKRIVDATMNSARNEVIVKLCDIKTMKETDKTNQEYYFGTDHHNAMKQMDFYVPDLTKYAGDTKEAKAKDALFSKEGIKQMLPMMNFFGKNAFAKGVRVYCAKDMRHYNIGDFKKIQKRMQRKTWSSKKRDYVKLTDDLSNPKYFAKQQKILEYQSVFTQEYLDFVRQENLNTDIQKELEQNQKLFENLPIYDVQLVKEASKAQHNVHDNRKLFGPPTECPIVCSRENSKDSQAFNPEALLKRLNSANIRPPNNRGSLQNVKTGLPLLPDRNGSVNNSNTSSRPPSSTVPAGFQSIVNGKRPPSSVPTLPAINPRTQSASNNSGEQSGQVSVVSSNGQRPPSSVITLPPIANNREQSSNNSGASLDEKLLPSSGTKLPPTNSLDGKQAPIIKNYKPVKPTTNRLKKIIYGLNKK